VLVAWMLSNPVPIDPLRISKLNTAAQIALAATILAALALEWPLDPAITVLIWTVAALTVGSAAAYLIGWLRHMGPRGAM
jgi:cardiolipin synthase